MKIITEEHVSLPKNEDYVYINTDPTDKLSVWMEIGDTVNGATGTWMTTEEAKSLYAKIGAAISAIENYED